MRKAAQEGRQNFLNRFKSAVETRGFSVNYCGNRQENLKKSATRNGYTLFHKDDPFHDNALTMRRVYYFPFWQIENSAKRWEWEVAETDFQPSEVDRAVANSFVTQWRSRLFEDWVSNNNQGFIYMPLQGKLLEQRSFQACSPIEMIRQTLEYGPKKPIIATLHPGENYTAEEFEALAELVEEHPELAVYENKEPKDLLPECDCVVTQNSAVAFAGYFWNKPAVLFGKIDFHHIALNVDRMGVKEAFKGLAGHKPEFNKYIYWFLQIMSINAGRPEAEEKILEILRRRGWDL